MSENTLTVAFRLFGKRLDPEEVSAKLGVDFTESHVGDGESLGFWILSRSASGYIDVSEICHQIVDELVPKQETILDLTRRHDLRAGLTLELHQKPRTDHELLYGEYPITGFRFDTEILKFLGAIGAEIYIESECDADS